MTEYKNVGDHVYDLANGQMLGVGETAPLSADEAKNPHNASLIKEGILIPTKATTSKEDPDA